MKGELNMKQKGMKGMSLLVMLGFVLSVLTVFAPVGAADGRAGSFVLNVSFSDDMGGTTNNTHAMTMVNITANVSLDAGQENVTDLQVSAYANDEMVGATQSLGDLAQGQFEDYTWQWMPLEYGDYTIKVTAQNGTDVANMTEKIVFFRSLASNITIDSVTLTAQSALIGVDEVTITAALVNHGNAPGQANVTFGVGEVPLGFVLQDVPAGGNANAVLMTKFDGLNLTDGSYAVGALVFDWQISIMMATENVTLTNPAAKLSVDSLLASAASALEGTNVTLTARLNNSGTADAMNLTVDFLDGATAVHSETNVSVDMGQVKDITYIWVLPDVSADTTKTITAKLGTSSAWVNVTIIAKMAVILITDFTVPDGMRIGDVKNLTATVKNNGTGDATGVVVEFYDGTTKLVSSPAFNLTAGSSTQVSLAVTLAGTADAIHTFFVKATGAEKNTTKLVAHKQTPASVGITSFTVAPTKKDKQPQDSTQSFTLTVVLKNSGELKSNNCTLTIKEGTKAILLVPEGIALDGNGTVTKTYTWKVKGSGGHTATATLTGADAAASATKTTKATLEYTPGFEVLFLVAAIIVAAILVRRRKN
jgi:hypothetical protein